MLNKYILPPGYANVFGHLVLEGLQNNNMPTLDLLVREAIQNSSDASIKQKSKLVNVNFSYGTFYPEDFNNELEGISKVLNKRYQTEKADYLEIRDKSMGLTGPTSIFQVTNGKNRGNYFKLVFDTGKKQTEEDSGGSWGFGKSVYYRTGIGIVIFYSQIETEPGKYESRLIVCLVEDEEDPKSILNTAKEKNQVGRAWWGKSKGSGSNSEILPISDKKTISKILRIFHLSPFDEDETGTSIIIPYIDKQKLLDEVYTEDDEDSSLTEKKQRDSVKSSIEEYTKFSILKWYAPRINNTYLLKINSDSKKIIAKVNDTAVHLSFKKYKLFILVQELYNTALSALSPDKEKFKPDVFQNIYCKEILIHANKIKDGKAGFVSYIKTDSSYFGIKPNILLGVESHSNDNIVAFARNIGMIIDYKTSNEWNIDYKDTEDENKFLIVFFLPDCKNTLKPSGQELGTYLKECEKSDHLDWKDTISQSVIKSIQRKLKSVVKSTYTDTQTESTDGSASRLSGFLGKRLLPNIAFGKKPVPSTGGSGGGSGNGGKTTFVNYEIESASIIDDALTLEVTAKFKNAGKKATFEVFVQTEDKRIDLKKWINDIGNEVPYPFSIKEAKLTVCGNNGQDEDLFSVNVSDTMPEAENDFTKAKLIGDMDILNSIIIENNNPNETVKMTLKIQTSDRKYSCDIGCVD